MSQGAALTDEARGETAVLLHQMEPDVQAVRQKLFKNVRVPFPSWVAARAWIERESARQPAAKTGQTWKEYERVRRACAALAQLTGRPYKLEPPLLAYRRLVGALPAEHGRTEIDIDYVRVMPSSVLGHLKRAVGTLAEGSGLGEEEILAHILVGYRPFLSPYQIHIQRRTLSGRWTRPVVELTLNVQDVPWKDLRELHRGIRQIISRQRHTLNLTGKESKLLAEVRSFGGKPGRSGAGEAWEQLARKAGYPNGQAARVAYGRIRKKQERISKKRSSKRNQRMKNSH